MFKNTSPEKARQLLGPDAYTEIKKSFGEELLQSGYQRSPFLADYLKDIEALKTRNGKLSHGDFHADLRKFVGCSLITLLMRDGYTPGQNYPIDGRIVNEAWVRHVPEFGLAMSSIQGLSLDEVKQSCGVLAGIRIEIAQKERARYLLEFEEYTPTYPRNQRNQSLIIKSYLESFSGIDQMDVVQKCRPLALLMGLGREGYLCIDEWKRCTDEHEMIAYSAFGAVGNKWAKREKSILENRFAVLDSNIALLTTIPAQMLYLEGWDIDDIVQGLTARVSKYAKGLLGSYRDYDDYVEFSIKRPFFSFPELWSALGITAKDLTGIALDEPEIDEIFKKSTFRNGMLSSLDYSAHVNLDTSFLMRGHGKESSGFWDIRYFKQHGWMAHNRLDPESLDGGNLEVLLDIAIKSGRGVPTMLFPVARSAYGTRSGSSLIEFITKKLSTDTCARFLLAMLRRPGQAVSGVDGSYIEGKDLFIQLLAKNNPELLDRVFGRLLDEPSPPKGLTSLFLKHVRPSPIQMKKIKGSNRDIIISKDLGL